MTTVDRGLTATEAATEAEAPRVVGKRRSTRVLFQSMLLHLLASVSPSASVSSTSVNSVAAESVFQSHLRFTMTGRVSNVSREQKVATMLPSSTRNTFKPFTAVGDLTNSTELRWISLGH